MAAGAGRGEVEAAFAGNRVVAAAEVAEAAAGGGASTGRKQVDQASDGLCDQRLGHHVRQHVLEILFEALERELAAGKPVRGSVLGIAVERGDAALCLASLVFGLRGIVLPRRAGAVDPVALRIVHAAETVADDLHFAIGGVLQRTHVGLVGFLRQAALLPRRAGLPLQRQFLQLLGLVAVGLGDLLGALVFLRAHADAGDLVVDRVLQRRVGAVQRFGVFLLSGQLALAVVIQRAL